MKHSVYIPDHFFYTGMKVRSYQLSALQWFLHPKDSGTSFKYYCDRLFMVSSLWRSGKCDNSIVNKSDYESYGRLSNAAISKDWWRSVRARAIVTMTQWSFRDKLFIATLEMCSSNKSLNAVSSGYMNNIYWIMFSVRSTT